MIISMQFLRTNMIYNNYNLWMITIPQIQITQGGQLK